jgi:L-ascorbate metabolism protein UlaG (beta-lactamase superfamily)
MRLQYIDRTCIGITSEEGVVIVIDPVEIGGFGGPGEEARIWADIAIRTGGTGDEEGGLRSLKGDPILIDEPGQWEIKGIQIQGHACPSPKETEEGARRTTVFHFRMDGLTLLHVGLLGHVPGDDFMKKVGPVDVLFIPTGGYGTINATQADEIMDRLDPRVVIPMHRPSGGMGFELEKIDVFLEGKKGIKRLPSKTEVSRNSLPNSREIWIMQPTK